METDPRRDDRPGADPGDHPAPDPTDQPRRTAADGDLESRVREALRQVDDPELGINIVDLGLVYDIRIEEGKVHIVYTLTTMGCPIGPLIEHQMRQFLQGVEGIEGFEAEMVFSPPWTPDKMSEEARAALGMI